LQSFVLPLNFELKSESEPHCRSKAMAEENSRRKWNPHAGPYLGEVSSLAFLNLPQHVSSIPYLLAGELSR